MTEATGNKSTHHASLSSLSPYMNPQLVKKQPANLLGNISHRRCLSSLVDPFHENFACRGDSYHGRSLVQRAISRGPRRSPTCKGAPRFAGCTWGKIIASFEALCERTLLYVIGCAEKGLVKLGEGLNRGEGLCIGEMMEGRVRMKQKIVVWYVTRRGSNKGIGI